MFKMFKVGELFDIHPTATYKMKNNELFASDGATPVLSNSSMNNGIGGYCGLTPTEQGEMITFSDTTTGADTMFYQSGPFIGYPHVQGMYPYQPNKWDEKCCLYVISCIRKSAGNGWNYAVKFNRALVKELFVELPVVKSSDSEHEYTVEDIDFEYMKKCIAKLEKERIAELEQERIAELDAYLIATGLDNCELTDEDKKILSSSTMQMFKNFYLKDIFGSEPIRGARLTKEHRISGNIPLITAGEQNEGVAEYISNQENQTLSNMLTIDMFGNCFYRDYLYKSDDNILSFGLNGKSTEEMLYIASIINSICKKQYNYARQYRKDSYLETTIPLPVIESSDPDHEYTPVDIDWQYMKRYIRAIEKLAIADVVKHKDRMIAAAKQVINT